jgi:D-3-phosphoglycerate dehydrogenase
MRVLLSTCSFQDTPGPHHDLLESQGWDIVRERGPLGEARMLEIAGGFDAFLCGDDAITKQVLEKSGPRLKIISKYGIGLDKIDLKSATAMGIPVLFTPGVNHTTVAEHTFCLLLAMVRNLIIEVDATRAGLWKRVTGNELWQKTIGVVGLGRIGQEVIKRARGFDMTVHGMGSYWPEDFAKQHGVVRHESIQSLIAACDVLTLHTNLSDATRHLIDAETLALAKDGLLLINTARAEIVDQAAVLDALASGKLGGYATDVLDQEPPPADHPLLHHPKVIVTPHIGSRTFESVPRQALKATNNLINAVCGSGEIFCANGLL